jgi:hypothetical protein
MIHIKVARNKLYKEYLNWLNPVLKLSKGEIDILSSLLLLYYTHKDYNPKTLVELLLSERTKEAIRKTLKINTRLFNKLFNSLVTKGIINDQTGINKNLLKFPDNGKLKIFVSLELEK